MAKPPKSKPANKKSVLTEAQKDDITMRLAMFDTPTEIAADYDELHGIALSRQAIAKYDPTTAGSYQRRKAMFQETRASFLKEISSEPIANKAYRIRRLAMLHHKALKARDLKEARAALEQAAKEVGDVYTKANASALVVPIPGAHLESYDVDEKRNMLADRLSQVFGKGLGNRATTH